MKVPPLGYTREEIRKELNRLRHPLRIAVDRAKNPFNVGTIIRTAHSFLVAEVILIGSEPWYERAAMGMQRYENIREVSTPEAFVDLARQEGWTIVALEKDHAQSGLWDAELGDGTVLVFGNEDEGVSRTILDAADEIVGIPMYGINHSYPISVAAGIAMAEWARRRYAPGTLVVPRADTDPP
ncbi:MAG: RNA methyltransferase [Myxococcales bacterium]|nr:RNA methyltransferase [Myxococcales bacterium]